VRSTWNRPSAHTPGNDAGGRIEVVIEGRVEVIEGKMEVVIGGRVREVIEGRGRWCQEER
jgi:hypothetical protein